jgi:4-amino-4-deoxy-L-arabinose transferase-like glycosyltransferase
VRRFFEKTPLVWVCLYFIVLTIGMTWPLVTRMGNSVVGMIGDNVYFVWMIGWFKQALFVQHANPFDIWFLNYPEGWSLAYTEITQANLALALPFTFIGNEFFAYNAAMMLTFVLSGVFMSLWVHHLCGRWDAALIAGTIYAFLPYHFAHFRIGHLNLAGTQWFPLFFWGILDILQARKVQWRSILLTGISLGMIAMTSQYYFYMCVLVTVFTALIILLFRDRPQLKNLNFWKNVVLSALVSLPLIIFGVWPYLQLFGQGDMPDRNISIVRQYSASITDFLLPSTEHFLIGEWIGTHFNRDLWIEGSLTIGFVALVLLWIAWRKRKDLKQEVVLRFLLIGLLVAVILAMGTDLHWNERSVEIPLQGVLAEKLGRDALPIPLPGYLFFYVLPFFAKLRALMRFGVFALVFSSAAAGLGASWVLRNQRGWARAGWTAGLIVLVLFEFYPGAYRQFGQVKAREADRWLREQPGQGALMQFPFDLLEDQEHIYDQLINQKPFVGGFFNAFPPQQYSQIRPVMEGFPDEESLNLTEELGVEYVFVDGTQYVDSQAVIDLCEQHGWHYVDQMGDELVFIIKDGEE